MIDLLASCIAWMIINVLICRAFVVFYRNNSHECEWMMSCCFKVFSFEASRFSFLLWAVMESRRVLTESRLMLSYGRVHLSVGKKWLCLVVMYLFRLEDGVIAAWVHFSGILHYRDTSAIWMSVQSKCFHLCQLLYAELQMGERCGGNEQIHLMT